MPVHESAEELYRGCLSRRLLPVFGKETKGLPEDFLRAHYDACVRIPMRPDARSLNLSNAVAVTVYEALRQLSFPNLRDFGKMRE